MKNRMAIFDFCETLIGFQTLDPFIEYVNVSHPTPRSAAIHRIFFPLKKLRLLPNCIYRRVQIARLKGISKSVLSELSASFVEQKLLPFENPAIAEKMRFHQNQGDTIVIASGGLAVYIDIYAQKKNIEHVVATELSYDSNGVCRGRISDRDCLGSAKVRAIKEILDLNNFDLPHSAVYSDSMSDLPLFRLVGHRFLVRDNARIQELKP